MVFRDERGLCIKPKRIMSKRKVDNRRCWEPTYAGLSRRYRVEKKMCLDCAALRGV